MTVGVARGQLTAQSRVSVLVLVALSAITAACGYGLVTRLSNPLAGHPLGTPFGSATVFGIVAVTGIILALAAAASHAPSAVRGLASAAAVVLVGGLYFTSFRGAWIALGFGLAVAIAADPDRRRFGLHVAPFAPLVAAAVWSCSRADGSRLAASLAAVAVAASMVPALVDSGSDLLTRLAVVAAFPSVGLIAGFVAAGVHPVAVPVARVAPPTVPVARSERVAPRAAPGIFDAPRDLVVGGEGSFASSDPLLNRIWSSSVATAASMVAPGGFRADSLDRPCAIGLKTVILDGWRRDRCPYIGDEAVIDLTLDASEPRLDVQRAMLAWFAREQRADGAIPASPIFGGTYVLFDYNAYWIQTLYEYALHSGDLEFVRRMWPHLERLAQWYERSTLPNGLLVNRLGARDYAYIHRRGTVVAYYNAQYVLALREAARLGAWLGADADAARWTARADATAAAFGPAFWDASAGAFRDTIADSATHPQDGNSFAVLAGLASPAQQTAALGYLDRHNRRFYGNTFVDTDTWNNPLWGRGARQRVYPFISYFEVLARFAAGADASAFELLRREWGYMLAHDPTSTMWETIGPNGRGPVDTIPSWDAGWSSGAAPALTAYVLGVRPTAPGFAEFTVTPHVGDLKWAYGTVPTPHGPIRVSWQVSDGRVQLDVHAPAGTVWAH